MKQERVGVCLGATRVAINGFGRIGRLVARIILEQSPPSLELVGINDLMAPSASAWLFARDSVHGPFAGRVRTDRNAFVANGKRIAVTNEPDPQKLHHEARKIDIALECTGRFSERSAAAKHLFAGARRVLVSGPAKNADLTIVYGINEDELVPRHKIVSAASCTTNCLALVAKVLDAEFGIERGLSRTVHGYTSEQEILDSQQQDFRRARAAAISMIPVATVSPDAVGDLLPQLRGRLRGSSVRVPVPNVSLIELTFEARQATTPEAVNQVLRSAAGSRRLAGVLGFTDLPLVSMDFNHTRESAIVDGLETKVVGGTLVRVLCWYDNEWAYAHRLVDVAVAMSRLTRSLDVTDFPQLLPEIAQRSGQRVP